MNSKEKKRKVKMRLEIHAKKLIKKMGNSIREKGREFTGNPPQSCMLAEAFHEEIKTFSQPVESMP